MPQITSGNVRTQLSQQQRLAAAVLYFGALLALNQYLNDSVWPPYGIDGLWFYSAAAALLLGEFVLEPFFTRPADALASALAVLIAAGTVSLDAADVSANAAKWGRIAVICAAGVIIGLAVLSIAFKDATGKRQRIAAVAASTVARVGRARWQFSALLLLSGYAAFADSSGKVAALFGTWIAIFVAAPAEAALALFARRRADRPLRRATVEAIDDPGIVVAQLPPGESAQLGATAQLAVGGSGTVVEVTRLSETPRVRIALDVSAPVPLGSEVEISDAKQENPIFGHVVEGTTIDEMVVASSPMAAQLGLEEGRLAEASVGETATLYQIVGAEVVQRADPDLRRHLVRVRARKLGRWNEQRTVFEPVGWVPAPGTPVRLLSTVEADAFIESAVGRVPGTTYAISVDPHLAVTHNTAILGILGIGKTRLAWELMKRMLMERIKVVALDITGRYAQHFSDVCSPETEDAIAKEIEQRIVANVANRTVRNDQAGNLHDFQAAMKNTLSRFVAGEERLLILNPNRFVVTRMEGRPLFSGDAHVLGALTMVDVMRIIAEQLLELLQARDRDPRDENAVLCLILEEAHSLVPEWTSAANESERQAVNGTARAILQGRKYGYGCLLVTQRTANVTKSILNQCNTVFGMRVYDATGMGFLENYIGPTYAPILASLRDRQAVIFGRASSCNSPIIIELNDSSTLNEHYWAPRANTIPRTRPPVAVPAASREPNGMEELLEPEPSDDDIPF